MPPYAYSRPLGHPLGQSPDWKTVLEPFIGVGAGNFEKSLGCPALMSPLTGGNTSTAPNYNRVIDYTVAATGAGGSMRLGQVPAGTFLVGESTNIVIYTPQPALGTPKPGWPWDTDTDGDGVLDSNASLFSGTTRCNNFIFHHDRPNGSLAFNANMKMSDRGNVCFADGSARVVSREQWLKNDGGMWGP